MELDTYFLFWICIIGLCFGSFFNVVILRSLSGESIVLPPSKCPKCGHKLYFWHNIPVLSYILLRGKCYFCKEKISIQYPMVELVTMIMFAASFLKFGISYTMIFVIFWLSCLLIMTVTDIKEKLVDCNLAIAVTISGILYSYIEAGRHGVLYSVLGLIAGALIMEVIARAGFVIAKTRAMGEADTYVAASLGSMFGIFSIVKVLLMSLFASMVFILPVFLYNKYKSGDKHTCIAFVLFVLFASMFYLHYQTIWMLMLLLLTGILLLYLILKGIKQEANRNYLPYVPALAAAALYYIFFVI